MKDHLIHGCHLRICSALAPYTVEAGGEWQEITIEVPIEEATRLLRIRLAGAKAMEFRRIRWNTGKKTIKEWDFPNAKP